MWPTHPPKNPGTHSSHRLHYRQRHRPTQRPRVRHTRPQMSPTLPDLSGQRSGYPPYTCIHGRHHHRRLTNPSWSPRVLTSVRSTSPDGPVRGPRSDTRNRTTSVSVRPLRTEISWDYHIRPRSKQSVPSTLKVCGPSFESESTSYRHRDGDPSRPD